MAGRAGGRPSAVLQRRVTPIAPVQRSQPEQQLSGDGLLHSCTVQCIRNGSCLSWLCVSLTLLSTDDLVPGRSDLKRPGDPQTRVARDGGGGWAEAQRPSSDEVSQGQSDQTWLRSLAGCNQCTMLRMVVGGAGCCSCSMQAPRRVLHFLLSKLIACWLDLSGMA